MAMASTAGGTSRGMTREEKKVIFASSLGTVFEWYDFYLAGSLAANISQNFVPGTNDTAKFIFVLFGFAAGFAVRPFGGWIVGASSSSWTGKPGVMGLDGVYGVVASSPRYKAPGGGGMRPVAASSSPSCRTCTRCRRRWCSGRSRPSRWSRTRTTASGR